jgi:hypothetical protein
VFSPRKIFKNTFGNRGTWRKKLPNPERGLCNLHLFDLKGEEYELTDPEHWLYNFYLFHLKGEEYKLTDSEGRRLFGLSVYEHALLTPDEYYNLHLFDLKGEEYELTDPEGRRLFGLSVYERALLTTDELRRHEVEFLQWLRYHHVTKSRLWIRI